MNIEKENSSVLAQADQSASEMPAAKITSGRNNNFNLLRLFFATLVLLSHSPEIVDGDRRREILTRIFGTISFGELAVNGFFLLSGFLIVQSWERKPELFDYLKKRVLRIYPAFIVASFVSAFLVGPFGSEPSQYFAQFNLPVFLKAALMLSGPEVPPVFKGAPYPYINGSLWTIGYEFRCYLLVAVLGLCGVIARRNLWLTFSLIILFLFLALISISPTQFTGSEFLVNETVTFLRLLSFFSAGGCFYLFRDRIKYKTSWVLVAAAILCLCMFNWRPSQLALVVLGGYILFWFAFAKIPLLERFSKYPDVSYGVYLYGWPIQKLLIWHIPGISPWVVFVLTCFLSGVCGLLSWHLVEHPFLRLVRKPETPSPASSGIATKSG